jgi:predicted lactoylglutathione lyase
VKQRVSLITLGVSDLGRARRFYEALGWGWTITEDGGVKLN